MHDSTLISPLSLIVTFLFYLMCFSHSQCFFLIAFPPIAFTTLSSLYRGIKDSIIKFTKSYLRFCITGIKILLIEILFVTERWSCIIYSKR